MSKLTRITGKVFGATASPTGDTDNGPYIGQFGSAKLGTYNGTSDVATIQSLSAWSNGWIDAVTPNNQYPPLPERTGVDKVLSYQECYLLQQGIAEWDSTTDYHTNCYCSYDGIIYISIADNNVNVVPGTDEGYWKVYQVQTEGDWANIDLNNLSSFGNARLQYVPFSINRGNIDANGDNKTLYTENSNVYKKRDIQVSGTLTYTNNTIVSGFGTSNRCASTYLIDYNDISTNNKYLEFQVSFTLPSTLSSSQFVVGGYSQIQDPIMIRYASSNGYIYVSLNHVGGSTGNAVDDALARVYVDTSYTIKITYSNGTWSYYLNNEFIKSRNYDISRLKNDYIGFGTEWSVSGARYPFGGSIDLERTYIKIDNTVVWSGVTNGTSSSYDWVEGAGTTIISSPCLLTTCDGRTVDNGNTYQVDVSEYNNGTYVVFDDISNNNLVLVSKSDFKISKSNPQKQYWLDISILPAQLKVNNVVNNDLVPLGECEINSGTVQSLYNYQFNMNGYYELANLPDYNSKVSLTNGTTYTAEKNGWILNGNTIVQTIYVGDSYSVPASGYYFAFMKGY